MTLETEALELIERSFLEAKPLRSVVCFSGGKDSTVVLDLVRRVRPDTPAMFNDTGVEAPETYAYLKTIPNLIINRPANGWNFWKIVDKYGWPTTKATNKVRHGNMCCKILKEDPGDRKIKIEGFTLIFDGITSAESRQRRLTLQRIGPFYFRKGTQTWGCRPIHNWSEKDVWAYIRKYGIPYNKGYDLGWTRCGCMPCSAHKNWLERMACECPRVLRVVLRKRFNQHLCGDFVEAEAGKE